MTMTTEWPIFYRDELKIGNSDNPVALCTLWTRKEIVSNDIPEKSYALCGNLYTVQGINPLIKNVLAKPSIRYIVLCGADLMKSGDALVSFFSNGIDSNRKIVGASGRIDSNIPEEHLEKIKHQVEIIDMRGHEKEMPESIAALESRRPLGEPVIIKELESSPVNIDSKEVAAKVKGGTVSQAWLKALDTVMKFGETKQSDYGVRQKEFIDLVAVIEGDDTQVPEWLPMTKQDLDAYTESFFTADKPRGVDYTYGERLFRYTLSHVPEKFLGEIRETKDQIDVAAQLLKERPFTRRAVAFTLRETDAGAKHPPCLTQITFNIKDNRLVQTAVFRSHDIFGAWLLNVFALRKLQKRLAEQIGISPGPLVVISQSAHIYENNWQEAKAILDRHHTDKTVPFSEDEHGYFIIKVEDEIIVEHYTKEGLPSGYIFRGKKAQPLYRRICNEQLFSRMDHAAYIGHELARAEIVLRQGTKFVQDEA